MCPGPLRGVDIGGCMKQIRYSWTSRSTGATGQGEWLDIDDQIEAALHQKCLYDAKKGIIGNIEYREKP